MIRRREKLDSNLSYFNTIERGIKLSHNQVFIFGKSLYGCDFYIPLQLIFRNRIIGNERKIIELQINNLGQCFYLKLLGIQNFNNPFCVQNINWIYWNITPNKLFNIEDLHLVFTSDFTSISITVIGKLSSQMYPNVNIFSMNWAHQ